MSAAARKRKHCKYTAVAIPLCHRHYYEYYTVRVHHCHHKTLVAHQQVKLVFPKLENLVGSGEATGGFGGCEPSTYFQDHL